MCGRFTLHANLKEIQETFKVDEVITEPTPSYNVAPTQQVYAVVQHDGKSVLEAMRWGLIPFWAKDASIGSKMINARAETLTEKSSFSRPLKNQRCLIVADGFYEWRKEGTAKIPTYIHLKSGKPFGFAGLYDTWKSPEGELLTTCTIITTGPNEVTAPIHDRMPVIMPARSYTTWLNPANHDMEKLMALLAPYKASEMEAWPVARLVNSPANNTPELIKPV